MATKKKTEVKETEVKETKKAKKQEASKKEVTKAPVLEAKAIAKNVRVTPRKVRLVIDLIRGKDIKAAYGILKNVKRSASPVVYKLVKSAVANATNNFGLDEDKLYIAEIYANDGMRMKRYLPRAKGSASGLVKRASTITVVVKMR